MLVERPSEASDLPPPPYTPSASDILTPPPSEAGETQNLTARPRLNPDTSAQRGASLPFRDESISPCAIEYFSTRPFTRGEILQNEGVILTFLTRPITFIPSTKREEITFPEPVETFFNRDVTFKDWNLFKEHLLPRNAASFESEKATFVLTPGQQEHVKNVLVEWNKGFFRPRRISVEAVFDASHQSVASDDLNVNLRARRVRRSGSVSSIATSASAASTASSISSIDPNDIESVPPATIRDLLTSIQTDPSRKQNLARAIKDIRKDFHTQARTLSSEERKELRQSFKREHRELKSEIRQIVREARQQQREERRAQRRSRRDIRRGSRRNTNAATPMQNERSSPFAQSQGSFSSSNSFGQQFGPRRTQTGPSFNSQAPPPFASASRTPTTASGQQRRKGLLGSAVETMNQFAKACEDACDLGQKHAVEVAGRIDNMFEEGERKLRGTSF